MLSLGDKSYDVYKLIRLSAHITPVEMETVQLEKQILGDECWTDANENKFSPRNLLAAYWQLGTWESVEREHPAWIDHIDKTKRADYSYPVLMYRNEVIDGMHRIIHALVDNAAVIPVRVLEELPEEALKQ
jgi:hypothetical protein